jgi:hypothetical protein
MPECIVCKGYYSSGTVCSRCGSDNRPWIMWRQSVPVEQERFWGLLHFTEPHFHMPFLLTATALSFGLMGIGGIWAGVNLGVRLLAAAVTVGICLVIIQGVYEGRHKLRIDYLLEQVKAASSRKGTKQIPPIRLNMQWKTILIPVIAVGLFLLLAYALVQFELLWKLSAWLFLEPRGEPPPLPIPDEVRARIAGALPLILMMGYIGIFPALVYYSSMMLAQQYIEHMNEALPHPIFLRGDLLTAVVRAEVEKHLHQAGRLSTSRRSSSQNRQSLQILGQEATRISGEWTWEDVERTRDGGIRLIARARRKDARVEESITGHRIEYPEFVRYTIEADRWGRIIRITQDASESQY